jgi:D-alanyl-D-alanine carboxypeptidase
LRHPFSLFVLLGFLGSAATAAADGPSTIVVDANSGAVISDQNSAELWYPASVTKLMTAYVTFRALKAGKLNLTSPVTESLNAQNEPPSKMGFPVGTVMNLDNALKMMLVHSANDIAVAVAETVGGSESAFVAMMNSEARRLGMNSTHFDNPNGLPDDAHVTTARDLAVLARALWVDFPEYRNYLTIPAIKAGKRVLRSQNTLLERYHGTNGMKTGFICASGFNMVVSATRVGHTLIAVVLGATSSQSRAETAARLLDDGFLQWAFLVNRPKLASFHSAPSFGTPVDMRPMVCERHKKQQSEDTPDVAGVAFPGSGLAPRFVLMDPVPVYTTSVPDTPAPAAKTKKQKPDKAVVGQKPARKTLKITPKSDGAPAASANPAAEGDGSSAMVLVPPDQGR